MIQLTNPEKQWIKLCKGHYQSKYPPQGQWTETMKPLFVKIYGWNPDEDNNYRDYLNCLFNKLLEIHLKIIDDKSGTNMQMRGIFEAAFYKGISRDQELPIERAISELCGIIQNNTVIEDGAHRYEL
jgi:hypothetical protein